MISDNEIRLECENLELRKELLRIKHGIKHLEVTMIVDGNDMADWGWITPKMAREREEDLLECMSIR